MDQIVYEGERLIFGQIGHFAIVASFVSALLATVAYFISIRKGQPQAEKYRKIGRYSFIFHGSSVLLVFGLIIYLLLSKSYEYYYVWQHVSEDLSLRYVLSAFWEGQEGSFLLWMFWHVILGFLLLRLEKRYEAPVIGTLSVIQLIIGSMLLGIYFVQGDDPLRIGINPFVLLRNEVDAPIFANADYLSSITGSGLNPLLQNYWMTIHPPILFLGFAATAIPFCYAIAGLTLRDHKDFLKAVLPWSLFAAASLGTGILLGGLWAYEALSFGGYWAWDPVENMSLVPWLVLVAGIHTNLIARATGHSIRSTYIFYLLTFILIVYSTFLTRSGVLGDTSVHAFTEMGLEWQLIIFMAVFFFWGFGLFAARAKGIPNIKEEESTFSREFWMFIGSLTLIFSAVLISFTTSIPVFNKLFDVYGSIVGQDMTHLHRSSPLDPVAHYNKYQMWIGIFIALLSSIGVLLRYKKPLGKTSLRKFGTFAGGSLLVATAIHWAVYDLLNIKAWQYHILLFTAIFTVLTNLSYIVAYVKWNLKASASAISHIGFGLLIVGIMASGLNKQFISTNAFAQQGLLDNQSDEALGRNITLLKGVPMDMSGYEVTYVSDSMDGIFREYKINFKRVDKDGKIHEDFDLTPNILYDRDMTKVAASNPSTKHYISKDIFTHIHALPPEEIDIELAREKEDSLKYETYTAVLNDTFFTSNHYGTIDEFGLTTRNPNYNPRPDELVIGAAIQFKKLKDEKAYMAHPFVVLRDGIVIEVPYQINELGTKVKLDGEVANGLYLPDPESKTETFDVKLGGTFSYQDCDVFVEEVVPNARHPYYDGEPDDISVGIKLAVQNRTTKETYEVQPIFVIRGRQNFRIMDLLPEEGILFEFLNIDPNSEVFTVRCYEKDISKIPLRMHIAENSGRTDYLVLEAIVFPGINFVWVGSIMMLLGLFIGIFGRRMKS